MTSPSPIAPPRESQLDSKLLVRALIELNIARKNMLSYPEGHHQVETSIQRAFSHLKSFLDQEKELSFGVLKDGLSVSGKYLEPGNAVIRDLAACLRDRRIAGVTFSGDLSPDDTHSFLRLITREAEDPAAVCAVEELPECKAELKSVHVHWVDYAKFHHAIGVEVSKKRPPADDGPGGSIWDDYVQYLTADALTASPDGTPIVRSREVTPADLADYVNSQAATDQQMLKTYERVIQDHLQRSSVSPIANSANHWVQEKFRQFIEALNPNLRKQFMSITFDQLRQNAAPPPSGSAFNYLPYSMVIDMLGQANNEGKEISPTLLNFVRKFGGIQDPADWDAGGAESSEAIDEMLRLQPINADSGILRRENYENFVIPDYDRTLQALIPDQRTAALCIPEQFDLSPHLEGLTEARLTERLAQALQNLLDTESDSEAYREHADNLMALADDAAEHGDFALLNPIYKMFLAHEGSRAHSIGIVARGCIDRFRGSKFIAVVLKKLFQDRIQLDETQAEMLLALGPDIVPQTLSHYLAQKTPAAKKLLYKVAAAFPFRVSSELSRCLRNASHPEFEDLRTVIALLNREAAAALLRPSLEHADRRIRVGALETLLRQKDPESMRRLEGMLGSRKAAEALTAIDLVGKCSVNEMVPVLGRMLSKGFLLFKADFEKNEKIIAVLKQMRGTFPREQLEGVLKANFTLFPARLTRMKATMKDLLLNE